MAAGYCCGSWRCGRAVPAVECVFPGSPRPAADAASGGSAGGSARAGKRLPPGKSTLNRMELTWPVLDAGRNATRRSWADTARLDALLVDLFLDWHGEQPERIVLDVDATDDPCTATSEGRFFHGYYRTTATCRFISSAASSCVGRACGRGPGRGGWHGGGAGAHRGRIRKRWPGVEIWLRGTAVLAATNCWPGARRWGPSG